MQATTLKINGMTCSHCVKAVEGALTNLTGVTIHEVKIGAAAVSITAPATIETARAAIEEEGYEVVAAE